MVSQSLKVPLAGVLAENRKGRFLTLSFWWKAIDFHIAWAILKENIAWDIDLLMHFSPHSQV